MSGENVQVVVRLRPLNEREKKLGAHHVLSSDLAKSSVSIQYKNIDRCYGPFDKVYGPWATQEEFFNGAVKSAVDQVLQGFSSTVFAYGQTGTGKTWTMEGQVDSDENQGVIPRSVRAIFEELEGRQADYSARVSFLELYNEELQDLLSDCSKVGKASKSQVVLRESRTGITVCNLEEVQVINAKDIFEILERGIKQRATATTLMNKNSSRSHSIFTLKVMIKELQPDGQESVRNGQLNLVDLAGSECVGRSGATQGRAREAGQINQSLLTLGRVITALVDRNSHIPYRDSKLTRLLQESLGGKAKTTLIATVTSASDALEETLSSLDYALKAKAIENRPQANERLSRKHLMKEVSLEIDSLRSMLQAARDKNGVYLSPAHFEQMETTMASQRTEIAELVKGIEIKVQEVRTLKEERDAVSKENKTIAEKLEVAQDQLVIVEKQRDDEEQQKKLVEDELASLKEAYASMQEELVRTNIELKATKAVITEQQAAEKALTDEAHATKRALDDAVGDIAQIHAKRVKLEEEAAHQRDETKAFEGTLTEATAGLLSKLTKFHKKNAKCLNGLQSSVESASQTSRMTVQQLEESVYEAMNATVTILDQSASNVKELSCKIAEQISTASSIANSRIHDEKDSIVTWQADLNKNLLNLQRDLSATSMDMEDLSSSIEDSLMKTYKSICAHVNQIEMELKNIQHWTEAQLSLQCTNLKQQKEDVMAFALQRQAATNSHIDSVVAEVNELMNGFKASTKLDWERHSASIVSGFDKSITMFNDLGVQVDHRIEESKGAAKTWAADVNTSLEIDRHENSARFSSLRDTVNMHGSYIDGVACKLACNIAETSTELDTIASELHSDVDEIAVNMQQFPKAMDAGQADIHSTKEAMNRTAVEKAKAFGHQDTFNVHTAEGEILRANKLSTDLQASFKECIQSLSMSGSKFVRDATSVIPPSGRTPRKRVYPAPHSFTCTRQADIIMDEVRHTFQQKKASLDPLSIHDTRTTEKEMKNTNVVVKNAKGEGMIKEKDRYVSDESARVIEPLAAQDPNTR